MCKSLMCAANPTIPEKKKRQNTSVLEFRACTFRLHGVHVTPGVTDRLPSFIITICNCNRTEWSTIRRGNQMI